MTCYESLERLADRCRDVRVAELAEHAVETPAMHSTICFRGPYSCGIYERVYLWYRQVQIRLDVHRDMGRPQRLGKELRVMLRGWRA